MPFEQLARSPNRTLEPSTDLDDADSASGSARKSRRRFQHPLLAVALAFAVLVLVELAVQARAQWRYGQSIFNQVSQTSRYQFDPLTDLMLLRPSTRFEGRQQLMVSNQYGLRGPAPPLERPTGGLRLAVLGASTAMGAYASTDATTVSALLQQQLAAALPGRQVEVINAGVVGFTLAEQTRLLDRLLWRFDPDAIIVMPGTNDMAGYCRKVQPRRTLPQPLWAPTANAWSLSYELLRKNTVLLTDALSAPSHRQNPLRVDPTPFVVGLQRLMDTAAARQIPLVLATHARAFRREQPLAEQRRLSESARYYSPCFDLEGLHVLFDRHNGLLIEAATARSLGVVRLDKQVPGGDRWFADAGHFTDQGNQVAAEAIADHLLSSDLLH